MIDHEQHRAPGRGAGIRSEPWQHGPQKRKEQRQHKERAQKKQNQMPPAKELRPLRYGIAQMLHRRKLKVGGELEIEQMNEQGHAGQRKERGEQSGIQEAHVGATIAIHRPARNVAFATLVDYCLLYTSPSPRDS